MNSYSFRDLIVRTLGRGSASLKGTVSAGQTRSDTGIFHDSRGLRTHDPSLLKTPRCYRRVADALNKHTGVYSGPQTVRSVVQSVGRFKLIQRLYRQSHRVWSCRMTCCRTRSHRLAVRNCHKICRTTGELYNKLQRVWALSIS
jgi:hypothetical protein